MRGFICEFVQLFKTPHKRHVLLKTEWLCTARQNVEVITMDTSTVTHCLESIAPCFSFGCHNNPKDQWH